MITVWRQNINKSNSSAVLENKGTRTRAWQYNNNEPTRPWKGHQIFIICQITHYGVTHQVLGH